MCLMRLEGAPQNILAIKACAFLEAVAARRLWKKMPDGNLRAVYALKKSITLKPWPVALPDDETLGTAFAQGWRDALADI